MVTGLKKIALLGSTGSIGTTTLRVVNTFPDRLEITALACGNNQELLAAQIQEFKPRIAATLSAKPIPALKDAAEMCGCELLHGSEGLVGLAEEADADVFVAAIAGAAGLHPVLAALDRGKRIALANKEVMVLAGELVNGILEKNGGELIPVDSEHSAIFQCLRGEDIREAHRLILCASGGPFFGKKKKELERVGMEDALRHPRWKMGRKITIDSATLMNKALEIIEARWLFDVPSEKIEVVVHPQCIIHSMVSFQDGSIMAQMGKTDMAIPVQYALSYPERWRNETNGVQAAGLEALEFHKPDREAFPSLDFAYEALRVGGTMPAILNAADEIAVASFLEGRLSFGGIFRLVEQVMERSTVEKVAGLEAILEADGNARRLAEEIIAGAELK